MRPSFPQGNHEHDIAHREVCNRAHEFKGVWLNSNMLDHELCTEGFETGRQKEFDVITASRGSNVRKLGLIAVLSDEANL